MTYLSQHSSTLRSRHYIIAGTSWNHWFGFTYNKVLSYRQRYGDDFCLIVNGSHSSDDAYVLPFSGVSHYFTQDYLTPHSQTGAPRWVGTIIHHQLKFGSADTSISVAKFHNRFDLLN